MSRQAEGVIIKKKNSHNQQQKSNKISLKLRTKLPQKKQVATSVANCLFSSVTVIAPAIERNANKSSFLLHIPKTYSDPNFCFAKPDKNIKKWEKAKKKKKLKCPNRFEATIWTDFPTCRVENEIKKKKIKHHKTAYKKIRKTKLAMEDRT